MRVERCRSSARSERLSVGIDLSLGSCVSSGGALRRLKDDVFFLGDDVFFLGDFVAAFVFFLGDDVFFLGDFVAAFVTAALFFRVGMIL